MEVENTMYWQNTLFCSWYFLLAAFSFIVVDIQYLMNLLECIVVSHLLIEQKKDLI